MKRVQGTWTAAAAMLTAFFNRLPRF